MSALPKPPFTAALLMPAWLGDCAMASALIAPLAALSGAPVQLWCRRAQRVLFLADPAVGEVLDYDPRGAHRGLAGLERFRAAARESRLRPAALWLVPDSFSSALAGVASGVRRRIGYGGQGRDLLLTQRLALPPKRERHWLEERGGLLAPFLAAAAPAWQPRLTLAPAAAQRLHARLAAAGVAAERCVVLVPGATYGPTKRWPAFAALGAALPSEWTLLVVGAPEERALCAELARSLAGAGRRVLDLSGSLDLGELAALLGAARCTVSGDTGPMHLAAAVGGRVLGLFLSTSPEWTAPLGPAARWLAAAVPCRPCFARRCPLPDQHCATAITPAAVQAAIADWLEAAA